MNCERSRELFADYLGEELAKGEAGELQLHLKACAGCRQELALLSRTKSTLKLALHEEPVPQHLAFTFSKPPAQPQGWLPWLRTPRFAALGAVTACFVICVASLALFRAQVQVGSRGLQISFGPSALPTADAPAPATSQVVGAGLKMEEVQRLIVEGLVQLEQAQKVRFERTLLETKKQWQMQRSQDLQQVQAGLRYLEANQKSLVQDAARNSINVQSLARNLYAKAEAPAALP